MMAWKSWSTLNRASIIIIGLVAMTVLLSALQPWVDPRWLYLDTQTVGELSGDCCHIYDGAFSTLGIMIWASSAAIAIFAAWHGFLVGRKKTMRVALYSAFVSALLALDDAYLLHEVVMPKLGVPQMLFVGMLGSVVLLYLWLSYRSFQAKSAWLIVVSLMAFATSVGIDQIVHSIDSHWVVLEDGTKLLGIVCWFLFHFAFFSEQVVEGYAGSVASPGE